MLGIRASRWVSLSDHSESGGDNDSAVVPNVATGVGIRVGVGVMVGAVVDVGAMVAWAQEAIRTIATSA